MSISTECGHTIERHWSWPQAIKHYTLDCTECGTELIMVNESYAQDLNKYLHGENPQWPIDGRGTGYVDLDIPVS